jgi:hypothetical protein
VGEQKQPLNRLRVTLFLIGLPMAGFGIYFLIWLANARAPSDEGWRIAAGLTLAGIVPVIASVAGPGHRLWRALCWLSMLSAAVYLCLLVVIAVGLSHLD